MDARRLIPAGRRAALAALLAALAGCSSPREFVRTVDQGHAVITRGICDIVDATDRAFGEPRVEDSERLVRLRIGTSVEVRENEGTSTSFPLSIRAPFPALERRANIFLQLDSRADTLTDGGEEADGGEERATLSATILTRLADAVDTGVRFELRWNGGAQTGARPFLRWEGRLDGVRIRLEQQGYLRSDDGLGARTEVQLDRVVGDSSFVRLRSAWETNEGIEGIDQEYVVIYRRPLPLRNAAVSLELGSAFNRFDGDPGSGVAGPEADPDETFFRARLTGKLWRPWIEYEISPAFHRLWHHEDPREWGITFSLRLIYEDFLRRGGTEDAAPAPEPFPEPPALLEPTGERAGEPVTQPAVEPPSVPGEE